MYHWTLQDKLVIVVSLCFLFGIILLLLVTSADALNREIESLGTDVVAEPYKIYEENENKNTPQVENMDYKLAESHLENSPMEGLGKTIVDTASNYGVDWHLIIGIAKAESSLGKNFSHPYDKDNCHNAWGIKPPDGRREDGSYLRCYYTWENGVESIAALISRGYKDMIPEQMVYKYVGRNSQNWVDIVKSVYP